MSTGGYKCKRIRSSAKRARDEQTKRAETCSIATQSCQPAPQPRLGMVKEMETDVQEYSH
jgi:hypothetical protein